MLMRHFRMQALAGGPLLQARNFAVMTGANAGISCVMKRLRGKDDVQSRYGIAVTMSTLHFHFYRSCSKKTKHKIKLVFVPAIICMNFKPSVLCLVDQQKLVFLFK